MLRFRPLIAHILIAYAIAAATPAVPPANTEPDVALLATVHAKQLQFDVVPDVKVTFPDQAKNQTVWHSDRTNLPQQVQPHVIYRDIGIRLTITSTLPDIEKIVDEALAPETNQTPRR